MNCNIIDWKMTFFFRRFTQLFFRPISFYTRVAVGAGLQNDRRERQRHGEGSILALLVLVDSCGSISTQSHRSLFSFGMLDKGKNSKLFRIVNVFVGGDKSIINRKNNYFLISPILQKFSIGRFGQ